MAGAELSPFELKMLASAYDRWERGDAPEALHRLCTMGLIDHDGNITNAGRDRVDACLGRPHVHRQHFPEDGHVRLPEGSECMRCHKVPGRERKIGSTIHGNYCDGCWHKITAI